MIEWNLVSERFVIDGGLRDIRILDGSVGLWNKILRYIKTLHVKIIYKVEGEITDLPDRIENIIDYERSTELSIFIQDVQINCFFDADDWIEFDISTNEVTGQEQLDIVCKFMKGLGKETKQSVLLTEENSLKEIILKFDPESEVFTYCNSPSVV